MAAITEISSWSVSIRKTNRGYQARLFMTMDKNERPKFYNNNDLHELLEHMEKDIIPTLDDNLVKLKR